MNNTITSFLLTFIAGFSTMIGTILIFLKVKNINKFICSSLAFASGVMFIISITDLIPESLNLLSTKYSGILIAIICFIFVFLGIILSMVIDHYIPNNKIIENSKLYKVGIISMLAIILHNIPEGIATFIAGNSDINLAISLTIAIALHNIPEGIAVALPIYHSTGKKRMAIWYSFWTGMTEPLGALIGLGLLSLFLPHMFIGFFLAAVVGIMIYISFDTLLPLSHEYGDWHYAISGVMGGIVIIWASLLLLHTH